MNMKSTWMTCCLLMLLSIPGMAKDNKTNKSNKYKLVWQEDSFLVKWFLRDLPLFSTSMAKTALVTLERSGSEQR